MNALVVLFKTEIKLSLREMTGVLFGVIVPVGLMILLGILYGNKHVEGEGYTLVQQSFGAVVTIGICSFGLMGIPLTLSSYRAKGVLKRFQVTPTSPSLLLVAHFMVAMVFTVGSSLLVYLIARFAYGYEMMGNPWLFILMYIMVLASIFSIGMMIASVAGSVNTVNLLASLIYFPTFLLSGTTVPYEIMPRGLQLFSGILPLNHGIKILKGISLGLDISSFYPSIAILIGTFFICVILSVKTFKLTYV